MVLVGIRYHKRDTGGNSCFRKKRCLCRGDKPPGIPWLHQSVPLNIAWRTQCGPSLTARSMGESLGNMHLAAGVRRNNSVDQKEATSPELFM